MIYINDIPSLRDPESHSLIFDDRAEKIPIINGVVLQDYGHIPQGDSFGLECVFSEENYNRIAELWTNSQRVNYTDSNGIVHSDLKLYFRNVRRYPKFPNYVVLNFELWRAK